MPESSNISRKPFEGVLNIIRFNWHFYAIALCGTIISLSILLFVQLPVWLYWTGWAGFSFAMLYLLSSLLISHYVYDRSDLYQYQWLKNLDLPDEGIFLNIHSGFDESSQILKNIFPKADWHVLDFYNPGINTEISIARARKYAPPSSETIPIQFNNWSLQIPQAKVIFGILAVHELRNNGEKIAFFEEATKTLMPDGKLILVEHLRDWNNFLAYGPGFFHFFSFKTWIHCLKQVNLKVVNTFKVTPFVQVFEIQKAI